MPIINRSATVNAGATKKEKKKKKKTYHTDFYMELHKITNYIKIYRSVFYNRQTTYDKVHQRRMMDKLGIKPSSKNLNATGNKMINQLLKSRFIDTSDDSDDDSVKSVRTPSYSYSSSN